jgi:hypothetical protein
VAPVVLVGQAGLEGKGEAEAHSVAVGMAGRKALRATPARPELMEGLGKAGTRRPLNVQMCYASCLAPNRVTHSTGPTSTNEATAEIRSRPLR